MKPSICAAAEARVSSAAKKMRARKPIMPPISVSTAIARSVSAGSPPSAAAVILSMSRGVSASVVVSATKSRICVGI
jgi:hypothetical protein